MRAKYLYPVLTLLLGLLLFYGLSWYLINQHQLAESKKQTEQLVAQTKVLKKGFTDLSRQIKLLFSTDQLSLPGTKGLLNSANLLKLAPVRVLQVQSWPTTQVKQRLKEQKKVNPNFKLQIPKAVWKAQESIMVGLSSSPIRPDWLGSEQSALFTTLPGPGQAAQTLEFSLEGTRPYGWWVVSTSSEPAGWALVQLDLQQPVKQLLASLSPELGYHVSLGEQQLSYSPDTLGVPESQKFGLKLGSLKTNVKITAYFAPSSLIPGPNDAKILIICAIFLLVICFSLYKLIESLEQEQSAHSLWLRRGTGYKQGLEQVRLTEGLDQALSAALEAICTYTGWPLAHAMIPDQSRQNAQANIWFELKKERFKNFIEAFESKNFQSGESLMDRVIGYEKIVWIEDISIDVSFSKIKVRYDFGVKAAVGIPVLVKGEIVTVLEFYSDQAEEWDQEKIDWSMAVVGQVGDLLEGIWATKEADHYHGRFAALFSQTSLPMATFVGNGRFEHINPAFQKAFGYTEDEIKNRSLECILGEHDKTIRQLSEMFVPGHQLSSGKTYRGKRKDGGMLSFEWDFTAISGANPPAWLLTLNKGNQPPTNRKMTVASHLSEGYKLQEALSIESKLRGDYLSALAMQIHSPIETMAAMTARLRQDMEPEERNALVNSLAHWGGLIGRKVNRALELSKVESDSMVLIDQPFDLNRLVEQSISAYAIPAYKKGVELFGYLNTDVKTALIGDHKRLSNLLSLLIENSVQFTTQGEVKVEVLLLAHTGNKVELRFVIKDTGKGIGEQTLHEIKKMITSAKKGPKSGMHGAIGLPLADGLAKRFGSGLKIESKPGQGTTASFTYRCLAQPENGIEGVSLARDLAGVQILLLSAHEGYGQMAQKTLSFLGAQVRLIPGITELKRNRWTASDFDLLVLDRSGLDTTKTQESLAELKTQFGKLPLLCLSEPGQAEKNNVLWDLATNQTLIKPLKQKDWYQSTMTLVGREAEISPAKIAEPTLSVLVVTNKKEDGQLVSKVFKNLGIHTVFAQSPQEAIHSFQEPEIDLALVDMSLPGTEGVQMLGKLREIERQSIGYTRPILAMTDTAEPSKKLEAISGGANDSLPKPLDLSYLVAMVQQHLLM